MTDTVVMKHDWQRYWYPREKEYIRSWWEKEEWFAFPTAEADSFVQVENLSQIPFLILLGDAGMGKSVVLDRLAQEREGSLQHSIDLRIVTSPEKLKEELDNHPTIINWKPSCDKMYLYLDALDEGMLLIDTICDLLTKSFSWMERSHLYVRVTCRPGLFPNSFKEQLKQLWGEEAVQVYQLAPLFLEEIKIASQDYGVEADEFLTCVKERSMHGFAYSPVTLKFLLNLYRINRNLPKTKVHLFKLGCLELCRERKTIKPNSNFSSADVRYEVAMLLAAITVFCNKPIISNHELVTFGEGLLELRDWPVNLIQNGYSASDAEEVLRSGLFREIRPMHFSWAHYSYAEFLASCFLLKQEMTVEQMSSLVFNEQWNVIPSLLQTTAWLGDQSTEMFELIVQHDPEILCLGDPSCWSDAAKRKALQALLVIYEQNWMYMRLGKETFYKQLYYDGIEELLSQYLKKATISHSFGKFVFFLIRIMNVKACVDDLFNFLALTHDSDMAKEALSLYITLGDDQAKTKLKAKLVVNSSEFFVHTIIQSLYPSLLSLEEITTYLRSWKWFTDYTILDVLSIEDRIRLREGLLEEEARQGITAASNMLDYLIIREAELMLEEEMWATIGERRMSFIGMLFVKPDAVRLHGSWEAKVRLLDCICKNMPMDKQLLAVHWFGEDDLSNLVELYLQADNRSIRNGYLHVIVQMMDPYNKDQIAILLPIYRSLEQGEEVLHAIQLGSPVCSIMKELPIPLPPSPSKKISLLDRNMSVKRLRFLLEVAWRNAQRGWPSLIEYCRPGLLEFSEKSVTDGRAWKAFSELEREQMVEASRNFLLQFDSMLYPLNTWKTNFRPVWCALQLVWERDSKFLREMDSDRLAILIPYIEEPNFHSFAGSNEMFAFAYSRREDVIKAPLVELQERRSPGAWYGSRSIAESRISICWDERITKEIRRILSKSCLSWTAIRDLLALLYQHDLESACNFSQDAIKNRFNGLTGWKRAVASLTKQLDCAPDGGAETIFPLLESSEMKEERFLNAVLRRYSRERPSFHFRKYWSPEQLVQLYVWVHRHSASFPKYGQGEASNWKKNIIGYGSFDELQPAQLLQIVRLLPDCQIARYQWELVRQNYERENWEPPSISSLIHMIGQAESRPITSGVHLLGVLRESLLSFEKEWRHSENPLVPLLWNEQWSRDNSKPGKSVKTWHFSPKDENTLSDTLKYHLSKDLEHRGVTFHREVEVFRSQGGESGARLDIKLDVPTSSGNKPLRAYIEVKGCWNNDLQESMEKQLIQKYLLPFNCTQGLYVIGWYNCTQWDKKWDYRAGRAPSYSLAEAKKRFQEEAEVLSNRYQVCIEVVVLDLSLR